jgi:hypothetical protein
MKVEGLTGFTTEELKKLLQLVYRDQVEFPLNAQRIACIGFQYKHNALINALRGLEKEAVTTVLVCVLAERLK